MYPFLPFFFLPATIFAIPLASSVNRPLLRRLLQRRAYTRAHTHARALAVPINRVRGEGGGGGGGGAFFSPPPRADLRNVRRNENRSAVTPTKKWWKPGAVHRHLDDQEDGPWWRGEENTRRERMRVTYASRDHALRLPSLIFRANFLTRWSLISPLERRKWGREEIWKKSSLEDGLIRCRLQWLSNFLNLLMFRPRGHLTFDKIEYITSTSIIRGHFSFHPQ